MKNTIAREIAIIPSAFFERFQSYLYEGQKLY